MIEQVLRGSLIESPLLPNAEEVLLPELFQLQDQPGFRFLKAFETVAKSGAFEDLINPPDESPRLQ